MKAEEYIGKSKIKLNASPTRDGMFIKLSDVIKLLEDYSEQLDVPITSQCSELLPKFLMHDLDGKIITGVIGSADVTKEWNEYLESKEQRLVQLCHDCDTDITNTKYNFVCAECRLQL